jgi:DNA-binding NtrC family response regulator
VVGIAERFIVEFSARLGKRVQGLTTAAGAVLLGYPWPGNVRELRNAVERAVLLCEGAEIGPEDLPEDVLNGSHANEELIRELERMRKTAAPAAALAAPSAAGVAVPQPASFPAAPAGDNNEIIPIEVEEMRIIERALRITGGDIQQAANRLQIGQATLYRKIAKFQFDLGNIRGKA